MTFFINKNNIIAYNSYYEYKSQVNADENKNSK